MESGKWGTGGMRTKLEAAQIATESGITVQLADGRDPKILKTILEGSRGGTVFHPNPKPLGNRKSWLAHALKPLGNLKVDPGACNALKNKGASLLLVGLKEVEGSFTANQPVRVINIEGKEIARGICLLSSQDLKKRINSVTSNESSPMIMHRDLMVLTG